MLSARGHWLPLAKRSGETVANKRTQTRCNGLGCCCFVWRSPRWLISASERVEPDADAADWEPLTCRVPLNDSAARRKPWPGARSSKWMSVVVGFKSELQKLEPETTERLAFEWLLDTWPERAQNLPCLHVSPLPLVSGCLLAFAPLVDYNSTRTCYQVA